MACVSRRLGQEWAIGIHGTTGAGGSGPDKQCAAACSQAAFVVKQGVRTGRNVGSFARHRCPVTKLPPPCLPACLQVFTPAHKKEALRYLHNHQNADGGFGLHIEGGSTMFGTGLK